MFRIVLVLTRPLLFTSSLLRNSNDSSSSFSACSRPSRLNPCLQHTHQCSPGQGIHPSSSIARVHGSLPTLSHMHVHVRGSLCVCETRGLRTHTTYFLRPSTKSSPGNTLTGLQWRAGKKRTVRSVSVSVTVPLEHSTTLQDFVKVLLELYFLSSNSSSLGKTQISRCCEGSSALSFPLKQRYVKSSELDVEVVKSSHKTKTKVSKYSEQSEKLLRTRQTPVSQYTHF